MAFNYRLSRIYGGMKARCYDPTHKTYSYYGGSKITVCQDWLNSWQSFRDWALINGYEKTLTIDRIDTSKDYSPENCRWVSASFQVRTTKLIRKTNTSGYRGVYLDKKAGTWYRQLRVDYKKFSEYGFKTAKEAAFSYNKFVQEHKLEHTLNILKD